MVLLLKLLPLLILLRIRVKIDSRLSVELNKTAGANFFKTDLPFAYAEDYGEEDACLGHWAAYVRKVDYFFIIKKALKNLWEMCFL